MTCFSPLAAMQPLAGGAARILCALKDYDPGAQAKYAQFVDERFLALPCGSCIGCLLARKAEWTARNVCESQMHDFSSFVSLTYDDEHLPYRSSLEHRHFQLFMKSLRKWHLREHLESGGTRRSYKPLRFFMCGEYGSQTLRPHYHAIIFGLWLPDLLLFKDSGSHGRLYTSEVLSGIWKRGFASVGFVTPESCAYVAGYTTKKCDGEVAAVRYERIDGVTGEVYQVVPEYARMSLRPGIGARWFVEFGAECFSEVYDGIVGRGGSVCKAPRYFEKLLSKANLSLAARIEHRRYLAAQLRAADSTPDRLAVREAVAKAKLSLKRKVL